MIPVGVDASPSFIGNDTADKFPVDFPIYESGNVSAKVVDSAGVEVSLTLGVDYSLDGVGRLAGFGSVNLTNAGQAWLTLGKLKTGYTLNIRYVSIFKNSFKFRDLGPHAPVAFEQAIDRLTMDLISISDDSTFVGPLAAEFLLTAYVPSSTQIIAAGGTIAIQKLMRQHVRVISDGGEKALDDHLFGLDASLFRDGMLVIVECVSAVDYLTLEENDTDYGHIGNGGLVFSNRNLISFIYSGIQKRFLTQSSGAW